MATQSKQLTPKQQQVFDALNTGEAPSKIAKRLKITPSGVYGHIRNIRQAGYTLPGERLNHASAAETPVVAEAEVPPTVAAAPSTPETQIDGAIEQVKADLQHLADEVVVHHEAIAAAEVARSELEARLAKLVAAREALA